MKKLTYLFLAVSIILLAACANAVIPNKIPGDECAGTYTGTLHVVSTSPPTMDTTVAVTTIVTKTTNDLVSMVMTTSITGSATIDTIDVAGTAYPISLSKTTGLPGGVTGPLTGTLDNKTLNFTLTVSATGTYTFAGTKP